MFRRKKSASRGSKYDTFGGQHCAQNWVKHTRIHIGIYLQQPQISRTQPSGQKQSSFLQPRYTNLFPYSSTFGSSGKLTGVVLSSSPGSTVLDRSIMGVVVCSTRRLLDRWLVFRVRPDIMVVRVVEFSSKGYKIRKMFA